MPKDLWREILKLETRLKDFVREEGSFIEALRKFIDKVRELNLKVEEAEKGKPREIEELMNLRLDVLNLFSEVLRKEGEAEHEKSHLLESYGSLLLALDEKFRLLAEKETLDDT